MPRPIALAAAGINHTRSPTGNHSAYTAPIRHGGPHRTAYGFGQIDDVFSELASTVCGGRGPLQMGIAYTAEQVRDYARYASSLPSRTPTICEVGFNCGHSTATFLEAHQTATVINFDVCARTTPARGLKRTPDCSVHAPHSFSHK